MNGYVIALDQGTTSSRAIVFDSVGTPVTIAQYPFAQIYPKPGWVEHDPMLILETQLRALAEAFEKSELSPTDIAGIGITNQRETSFGTKIPANRYITPLCGSADARRPYAMS